MMTILDAQALLVKRFFNFWGRLGGAVLNYGSTRGLDVRCDAPYGTHVEQRLDILAPGARSVGGLPVLIYLHGGGWISADKGIYRGIAATFARLGYLTFNLNYRLAPASRFPQRCRMQPTQSIGSAAIWNATGVIPRQLSWLVIPLGRRSPRGTPAR